MLLVLLIYIRKGKYAYNGKAGCIHKVHLRVWLREAHFVGTPKFYCCHLSWLVVTSQNALNLL